jgi:hypothetical protein
MLSDWRLGCLLGQKLVSEAKISTMYTAFSLQTLFLVPMHYSTFLGWTASLATWKVYNHF